MCTLEWLHLHYADIALVQCSAWNLSQTVLQKYFASISCMSKRKSSHLITRVPWLFQSPHIPVIFLIKLLSRTFPSLLFPSFSLLHLLISHYYVRLLQSSKIITSNPLFCRGTLKTNANSIWYSGEFKSTYSNPARISNQWLIEVFLTLSDWFRQTCTWFPLVNALRVAVTRGFHGIQSNLYTIVWLRFGT